MTGTGTNQGNTGADQNALVVSAAGATHPLGAGFAAGSVTTSSSATVTHGWGKPTANAVVAATITGDTTKAAIYGYDTGAAMQGGYTAPARRVGFHLYNGSSSVLNDNSVALFDAAIAWAAKSAPKVTYKRDATDRITERSANGRVVARYSYTGSGDTSDLTLDSANNVVEATLSLPGGALYSWRGAAPVWSYANTHGDVVVTTDNTGTKQGPTRAYDPYGQPLTTAAEIDNSAGEFDYGWLGEHQRPLEHQTGAIPIIEMGARQYDPTLGRFLEVDPVEGGCENDYSYPADPVNELDLNGMKKACRKSGPSRFQLRSRRVTRWKTIAAWGGLGGGSIGIRFRGSAPVVRVRVTGNGGGGFVAKWLGRTLAQYNGRWLQFPGGYLASESVTTRSTLAISYHQGMGPDGAGVPLFFRARVDVRTFVTQHRYRITNPCGQRSYTRWR